MIRMTVLYPDGPEASFDMDYYRERHMPMVRELLDPALTDYEIWTGVETLDGQPAEFRVLLEMRFSSQDAFQVAFASSGERITADIANYTNIAPVVQLDAPEQEWRRSE